METRDHIKSGSSREEWAEVLNLCVQPTGLFTASGHFDIPLISVVDGPILKPFGVVIVITGWFGLV